MSILGTLAESLRSRKQKSFCDYKALVKTVANEGKLPKTEEIEATLQAAGKSVEDLEADVKAAKRRNDLRAQIAMADALQKERPAIDAAIAKAAATLAKAQEVHDAAVAPLRQRIDAINNAHHSASMAASELQRTTPDEFDDRRDELEQTVRATDSDFRAAQKRLSDAESRLNGAQLAIPPDQEEVSLYRQQVESAKAGLKARQEAASDAVKAQDEFLRHSMAS